MDGLSEAAATQMSDTGAEFEVRVEPAREVVRVAPVGELDLATGPELRRQIEELIAVGFEHLMLDLRGLSFIDVTGVRLLLRFADQAQQGGWRLSLTRGPNQVQRILRLTGALDRLSFEGSHERNAHRVTSDSWDANER